MPAKIHILHTAAECAPFIKVGGLADVVGSLPLALDQLDAKVSIVLPLYHKKYLSGGKLLKRQTSVITLAESKETVTVYTVKLPKNPIAFYFISHRCLRRNNPYSNDIPADLDSFAFFSYALVELIGSVIPRPDVIHCHDWHTGLIPSFLDARWERDRAWTSIPTIFTIHNLAHQGLGSHDSLRKYRSASGQGMALLEDYQDNEILNVLQVAILSADKITTVSPSYSQEILVGINNAALAPYLQRRKKDFCGIINGIDIKLFNPANDKSLYQNYSIKNWPRGKKINKTQLAQQLKLKKEKPLIGLVTRLTPQKGLDILIQSLPRLLTDFNVVILGQGDAKIVEVLNQLASRFTGQLIFINRLDLKLAQRIYAASDFFLMPSRFEPCGLGQMIAMRYFSVPIVRATGGLKDTIKNNQTGLVFSNYSASALALACRHALSVYQNKKRWYTIVRCCGQQDFSWTQPAKKYLALYKKLL